MKLDFEEKDIVYLDLILEQLLSGKTIDSISVMKDKILLETNDVNVSLLQFEYYVEILVNHCASEIRDVRNFPILRRNGKTKRFSENGGFKGYYNRWEIFENGRKKKEDAELNYYISNEKLSKWLLKSKWWPLIIAFAALIISFIALFKH